MDQYQLEALLVEYQKTQDSAEHHDNLIYTVTSLIWGINGIAIGFILNSINGLDDKKRELFLLLCIIGMFINLTNIISVIQLNSIKKQKYERCKEIEKLLSLSQHTNLKYYCKKFQVILYFIISVCFVIYWILIGCFGYVK